MNIGDWLTKKKTKKTKDVADQKTGVSFFFLVVFFVEILGRPYLTGFSLLPFFLSFYFWQTNEKSFHHLTFSAWEVIEENGGH